MSHFFKAVGTSQFDHRAFDYFVQSGIPYDLEFQGRNMLQVVLDSSRYDKVAITHDLYKRGLRVDKYYMSVQS